jgi:hypothetical protein
MLIIEKANTNAEVKFKYLIGEGAKKGEKIDTCSLFSALAIQTWDRFQFAYERNGFKIYETTITQNLLYQIEKAKSFLDKKIILREAVNEKANGNDIEFIVTDGVRSLKMPMQAKRIYKNLRYSSIIYKGQTDAIIKYAKKVKGIPMYLLYNYKKGFFNRVDLCKVQSDERQYGCSIIDAIYIRDNFISKTGKGKKRSIPKFKDLVPRPSIPWIVIPCCLNNFDNIEKVFEDLQIEPKTRKKLKYVDYHSHEEIMKDSAWKELELFQKEEPRFPREDENIEPENKSYNPGFQIIITIN